jgi:hypothetical protein
MEAMPVAERITAEEFLALPVTEDTRFASLVEGDVVVNDPRPLHNYFRDDLDLALRMWARSEGDRGRVMSPPMSVLTQAMSSSPTSSGTSRAALRRATPTRPLRCRTSRSRCAPPPPGATTSV